MSVLHSENEVSISLWSVDNEQELLPNPIKININPPPTDGKCECCKKHISELQPFGKFNVGLNSYLESRRDYIDEYGHSWKLNGIKINHPKVEDFEDALLVKTWKSFNPFFEEIDEIMQSHFSNEMSKAKRKQVKRYLAKKYGKIAAGEIEEYGYMQGQVDAVWLCRDCFNLSDDDYYARLGYKMADLHEWVRSVGNGEKSSGPRLASCLPKIIKVRPHG